MEAVELELLCLPDGAVAVAFHVAGKSFGSPLLRGPASTAERPSSRTPYCVSDTGIAGRGTEERGIGQLGCYEASVVDRVAAGVATATTAQPAVQQQVFEHLPVDASSSAADNHAQDLALASAGNMLCMLEQSSIGPSSEGPAAVASMANEMRPDSSVMVPTSQIAAVHSCEVEPHDFSQLAAADVPRPAPACEQLPAPSSSGDCSASGAALDAVMGMLQQLLSNTELGRAQQTTGAAPSLLSVPSPAAPVVEELPANGGGSLVGMSADTTSSRGLPGGLEKLLSLELEVVQLQQSLQIAQLEFETRTVQLHSLKQRADEAEQRAEAAEERASGLAQRAQTLERQAAELRSQLGETAARHQQEHAQLSTQLGAAASRQHVAEESAVALRQQLAAAQQASEQAHVELRRAVAQQGEWQEQAAAVKQENQRLKMHMAAACGALKALGIPVHKVFSRAALVLAGHTSIMLSPPESPAEGSLITESPSTASQPLQQQQLQRPAQVPRLQLSNISLEQLQQQHTAVTQRTHQEGVATEAQEQELVEEQQQAAAIQEQQQTAGPSATAQVAGQPNAGVARPQQAMLAGEQQHQRAEGQPSHQQAPSSDGLFSHVMVAADGTPALGSCQAPISPADTSASSPEPAPTANRWQQQLQLRPPPAPPLAAAAAAEQDVPPLLTARRAVSPAQQELLAAAQQWQLTARSARSVADMPAEEGALISAYRPNQLSTTAAPLSARRPPATARGATHQTPRLRPGNASSSATPNGKPQRATYGHDARFLEIKEAYNAVLGNEGDHASRWARSVFSSSSAVESDPRKVEPMVQGLLQLFQDNGVHVPLHKCGPCQYRLGTAKLSVRLVNGRLMARAGAGQTLDVFAWLEKQPVHH